MLGVLPSASNFEHPSSPLVKSSQDTSPKGGDLQRAGQYFRERAVLLFLARCIRGSHFYNTCQKMTVTRSTHPMVSLAHWSPIKTPFQPQAPNPSTETLRGSAKPDPAKRLAHLLSGLSDWPKQIYLESPSDPFKMVGHCPK